MFNPVIQILHVRIGLSSEMFNPERSQNPYFLTSVSKEAFVTQFMRPVDSGKERRSKTAEEMYSSFKLLTINWLDQVISAVL